MDKKDAIFWSVVTLILLGTIAYTYWHFVVARDFVLVNYADCDPTVEACFVWECDPVAIDAEEQCSGDPEEDIWYYKIQRRIAANVPECDSDDDACEPFKCAVGEVGCEEILCTEETAEEEEVYCSDPATYNMTQGDDMDEENDDVDSESDVYDLGSDADDEVTDDDQGVLPETEEDHVDAADRASIIY